MPQMSPMNWILLTMISLTSLAIISMNLWNEPKKQFTTNSTKKNNFNWMW